jgi:hypothetical protein
VKRNPFAVPAILLFPLLILPGCMDIAIKAKLKPDGSATVTYRTTLDASLVALSKMGDSTKTKKKDDLDLFGDTAKKPGIKLLKKFTRDLPDGRRLSEAVFQAKNVTAFGDSNTAITFDKVEGKPHLVWPFKGKKPSEKKDSTDAKAEEMVKAMFAGKTFDFELEMPGKILTASGADSVRGSRAYYHRALLDLMEKDLVVEATSE